MRAITNRRLAAVLAGAKERLLVGIGGVFHRRDVGAGVAAVAKRLLLAAATGTPEIGLAGLDLHRNGGVLCNYRFRHLCLPLSSRAPRGGFPDCGATRAKVQRAGRFFALRRGPVPETALPLVVPANCPTLLRVRSMWRRRCAWRRSGGRTLGKRAGPAPAIAMTGRANS